MNEFNNPTQEDKQHCETGNHLWVQREDNSIDCYTCGKILKK